MAKQRIPEWLSYSLKQIVHFITAPIVYLTTFIARVLLGKDMMKDAVAKGNEAEKQHQERLELDKKAAVFEDRMNETTRSWALVNGRDSIIDSVSIYRCNIGKENVAFAIDAHTAQGTFTFYTDSEFNVVIQPTTSAEILKQMSEILYCMDVQNHPYDVRDEDAPPDREPLEGISMFDYQASEVNVSFESIKNDDILAVHQQYCHEMLIDCDKSRDGLIRDAELLNKKDTFGLVCGRYAAVRSTDSKALYLFAITPDREISHPWMVEIGGPYTPEKMQDAFAQYERERDAEMPPQLDTHREPQSATAKFDTEYHMEDAVAYIRTDKPLEAADLMLFAKEDAKMRLIASEIEPPDKASVVDILSADLHTPGKDSPRYCSVMCGDTIYTERKNNDSILVSALNIKTKWNGSVELPKGASSESFENAIAKLYDDAHKVEPEICLYADIGDTSAAIHVWREDGVAFIVSERELSHDELHRCYDEYCSGLTLKGDVLSVVEPLSDRIMNSCAGHLYVACGNYIFSRSEDELGQNCIDVAIVRNGDMICSSTVLENDQPTVSDYRAAIDGAEFNESLEQEFGDNDAPIPDYFDEDAPLPEYGDDDIPER